MMSSVELSLIRRQRRGTISRDKNFSLNDGGISSAAFFFFFPPSPPFTPSASQRSIFFYNILLLLFFPLTNKVVDSDGGYAWS